VSEEQVMPDTLDLQDDLQYEEVPIKILDTTTKRTRTKAINLCKVQWSHHSEAEATWEKEHVLREEYLQLFEEHSESSGFLFPSAGAPVESLSMLDSSVGTLFLAGFPAQWLGDFSCVP
jgi:hypothetical protein